MNSCITSQSNKLRTYSNRRKHSLSRIR